LADLKSPLRDSLSADLSHAGQGMRIDSALLAFQGPLQSALRRPARELPQTAELSQLSVRSLAPTLKNAFHAALDGLAKECSELQQMEAKDRKKTAKLELRSKALIEQSGFFECERIRQEIESETESELRQTIEQFRKVFASEDEVFLADGGEDTGARIRSAIARLRRTGEASLQKCLGKIGTIRRNLRDDVHEAVSLRDLGGFAQQKFVSAVQGEAFCGARAMREVGASSIGPVADSMKYRLREIQARREADLRNSASFLKSVLKEERRRIRSEVSGD
jgi:hypothetical protein